MGTDTTFVMTWYIKKVRVGFCGKSSCTKIRKGEPVKEDVPAKYLFYRTKLVADGPPTQLFAAIFVCEDLENKRLPVYRDSSTASQFLSLAEGLLTSCRCKGACAA